MHIIFVAEESDSRIRIKPETLAETPEYCTAVDGTRYSSARVRATNTNKIKSEEPSSNHQLV